MNLPDDNLALFAKALLRVMHTIIVPLVLGALIALLILSAYVEGITTNFTR